MTDGHDWHKPAPTLRVCRACGRRERWRWGRGWVAQYIPIVECRPEPDDDPGLVLGPGDALVITVALRPAPDAAPEPEPAPELDDWALLAPWLAALPESMKTPEEDTPNA